MARKRRSLGVIANSRIVAHRYADEGDRGKVYRRFIRRREERAWLKEWKDERA